MSHQNDPLFQPCHLGELALPNRVLMSPLTRSRSSQPGDIPNDIECGGDRPRSAPHDCACYRGDGVEYHAAD